MLNIQSTGSHYGEVITVKQISKAAAKKLFAAGETVYLQSSNMHPFGVWQQLYPIQLDKERLQADINHNNFCIDLYTKGLNDAKNNGYSSPEFIADYEKKVETHKNKVVDAGLQFNTIANEYSYYNCDGERGKYIHFYKRIK